MVALTHHLIGDVLVSVKRLTGVRRKIYLYCERGLRMHYQSLRHDASALFTGAKGFAIAIFALSVMSLTVGASRTLPERLALLSPTLRERAFRARR